MIRFAVRGVIVRQVEYLTITHEGRPKGPVPQTPLPPMGLSEE
ncbi:rev protein [Roseibium sp. TrichSKD4]|nr:rev protein [Roseibium sp. TrichSKD4]